MTIMSLCWNPQVQKREVCSDKKKKPSKSKVNLNTEACCQAVMEHVLSLKCMCVCAQIIWRQVYEAHDLCMSVWKSSCFKFLTWWWVCTVWWRQIMSLVWDLPYTVVGGVYIKWRKTGNVAISKSLIVCLIFFRLSLQRDSLPSL